jgi:putative transposase
MVPYAPPHGEQEIPYRSLSDHQWRCISPHLPEPTGQGRPRRHGLRAILDAVVFYVLKSGCPWRMLAAGLPALEDRLRLVYRRWRLDGTWERLKTPRVAPAAAVAQLGRNPQPSAGIVDSQSVKTTGWEAKSAASTPPRRWGREKAPPELVDTEGLVLEARVHNAKVADQQDGLRLLLESARARLSRLKHLWE